MADKPKVSVIVCCYNVAKWLCAGRLDDVYSQTYGNLEIILVDDGSTDETAVLLDAEASKDPRVRVIHKKNGGLGSARNAGLDAASGEYVWAFDIDDRVERNCVERCVAMAEEKDCDVLMFGFLAITPYLGTIETVRLESTVITSNAELRDNYLDRILFIPNGNGFFCNKFYRRLFLEKYNLRFENQRIQQDEVFNLKVYHHLEKCYISSEVFYHYYIYDSGNNRSRFIPDRFDIYKSIRWHFEDLKSFWNLSDQRMEDYLDRRFYQSVMTCLLFNLMHPQCTFTEMQKKEEIDRIMDDPLTIRAFKHAEISDRGLEQKLYRIVCRSRSLRQMRMAVDFFAFLRKVKKNLFSAITHKEKIRFS